MVFLLLYAALAVILSYCTSRGDTTQLVVLYSALLIPYFLIWSLAEHLSIWKSVFLGAIVVRVLLLFSVPNLSDDHYRYIWDGNLTIHGYNPYQYTPVEFKELHSQEIDTALFEKLNSKNFYSVYPPVSQALFAGAAYFGKGSIYWATVWLKIFSLFFDIGSMLLIASLLTKTGVAPPSHMVGYALNPLVVMELSGNVHFEVVMIFFGLLSLWFYYRGRMFQSGMALAGALATKLWPLLLVPFVLRKIKSWSARAQWTVGFVVLAVLVFMPFWYAELVGNMLSSIRLYYQYFEFNASLYYVFRYFTEHYWSYELFEKLRVYLPVALMLILFLYWIFDKAKDTLSKTFTLVALLYLLFATTVHPWYVAPLVAFGVLSRFRFTILWSALLHFTYITYASGEHAGFLVLEYVLLGFSLLFELEIWHSKIFKRWLQDHYLARARVKWHRIQHLLSKGDKILDIGTGNGALVHLLQEKGYEVTTVDIDDKTRFNDVSPIVYDGQKLPFDDQAFDVVTIITVLHHTADPEAVLAEAKRVGRQVIVMEDVYTSMLQKWITWLTDSIVNAEFWGHPHTNKTDTGWRQLFHDMNAEMLYEKQEQFLLFFRQVTYQLAFSPGSGSENPERASTP